MGWQETAATKQRQIWDQVPVDWHTAAKAVASAQHEKGSVHDLVRDALTPAQQQLTEFDGPRLIDALARGDVTAVEVLTAFARRAMLAHQLTRCLCENNWPSARAQASDLDARRRTYGSPGGPLHGVPVSLMDRFHVQGLDSACGFVSWLNKKHTAADEGTLVRTLRHLGAVVHCKTNVPMSLMLGETANNIIGITVNPSNVVLSAGGACGGEGALVALRGSALGVGTDVAGSSRIPAAFCGLWAIKCSESRLPQDGLATVLSGLPSAGGAVGMLANDHNTLAIALRSVLNSTLVTSDPDLLPIPWRQESFDAVKRRKHTVGTSDGRLVFGVLASDGHVTPHPPIQRAIRMTTDALRRRGHEVVEWKPPPHLPAVENLFKILGSTSAAEARTALKAGGEPPIPQLQEWYQHQDMAPSTSAEFWALCGERLKFRTAYKAYWNSLASSTQSGRIPDGVILPVAPNLAVRHGQFHYYGYSAIVNALDHPSGVFPVTKGDRKVDGISKDFRPLNELDEQIQNLYVPDDAHGMPVALQVMAPRLEEEAVLGMLEAIAECLDDTSS